MKTNSADAGYRQPPGSQRPEANPCRWRAWVMLGPLVAGLGWLPSGRADLSAPDNLFYGLIVLGTNPVTAATTVVVVEARRANGLPVARYRMGDRPDAGNYYLLAIKVEEIAPCRETTSVLANEPLTIVVASNGIDQAQQPFAVTERGQLTRIDFGTLPTNLLTGFEAWAWALGLDPSSQNLDADGDGVSNLAEYVAGTNPSDASSQFLLRIGRTPGTPRVSFDALRAEGVGYEGRTRHYALERRAQLPSGSWQAVPGYSDLVGNNQVVVYDAAGTDAPWFFRGSVWLDTAGNVVPAEFRLVLSHNVGQMKISFTALGSDALGRSRYHTLERCTNLVGGPWLALPACSNVLGSNQTVNVTDTNSANGPVFYRGRFELRNP